MGMHELLRKEAADLLPAMIALRRAIHMEPELGLHTPKTVDKVHTALKGLPLQYRNGASSSGFVAILEGEGKQTGRTVLLRGDMDALPLEEDSGETFSSIMKGMMHACGHDAHTAMLVGAAKLLSAHRESLSGTVMFMFQPGEEGFHGAQKMLDDGLFEPLPDAAFALHVMPNAPHGVISSRTGPLLASTDEFHITVNGQGGHSSMPHHAIDPIPGACEIVLALQSFTTRRIPVSEPAVITVGQIHGGTSDNIIPECVSLSGTVRALSVETRAIVKKGIDTVAQGVANAHGASVKVEFLPGYPVTVCDERAVRLGKRVVESMFDKESWYSLPEPLMASEDFSYILEQVPGAMFTIGASEEGSDWRNCCGVHSNRMVLDEKIMERGAAFHAELASTFLKEGFEAFST